jgi:hypothetical protein
MTVRISTVGAPSMTYLTNVATAYWQTFEHGVRVGLTASGTRRVIAKRLADDAAASRRTDWALLCDRLTGLARRRREVARG